MPHQFSTLELVTAMEKLLDGTWKVTFREINERGVEGQFFQVTKGDDTLSQGYDNFPRILELAIEADR